MQEKEEIPEEPEFIAVEKEPQFDLEELHRRVVYPEIARRNGVEGKVTIQVYIDRRGKPVRTKVAQSDNRILEQAAIDAILGTTFTPAIQNGNPIGVWMTIPVDFQLHCGKYEPRHAPADSGGIVVYGRGALLYWGLCK
jgi:protein TonB